MGVFVPGVSPLGREKVHGEDSSSESKEGNHLYAANAMLSLLQN